jgi:hypothetical protein
MPAFRLDRFSWFLSAAMSFASAAAVLFLSSVCASAVMAADDPQPPKSAVPAGASTNSASKPMVTRNPDGTFTVQKEPPTRNSKDAQVTKGLVIPPQVVTPIFSTPKKKQ